MWVQKEEMQKITSANSEAKSLSRCELALIAIATFRVKSVLVTLYLLKKNCAVYGNKFSSIKQNQNDLTA